jgi:hypothetical protein
MRDEGKVCKVAFNDITFTSRYHSAPWWGRGEANSFAAIPCTSETKLGKIYNILVKNVKGTAENWVRINGTKERRINNVTVKLNRWTKYHGNLFDDNPTKEYEGIEAHVNPG